MAKKPAPELVEAFNLIKAGQKTQAGVILKTYIAQNKLDAQAWWLMAHAVSNAGTRQRCLETVLKIDPSHEKARAQLAALTKQTPAATESPTTASPASDQIQASGTGESSEDDFPSDEMVLARITGIAAASSDDFAASASPSEPPASATPAATAATSEDLFAPSPATEPPAAAPPAETSEDLFAPTPADASSEDLFAPTSPAEPPAAAPATETSEDLFAPTPTAPTGEDLFAPTPTAPTGEDLFAPTPPAAETSEDLFAPTPADASSEDVSAPTSPAEPPAAAPPAESPAGEPPPSAAPGSFEEFLAADDTSDPFAGPPTDDPFADDPFESAPAADDDSGTPGRYDPFAAENVFNPSADVHLRRQQITQDAGTGNQPDWGPGLAFVTDSDPGTGAVEKVDGAFVPDADRPVKQQGPSTQTVMLVLGGAIVAVIIFALLVYGLESSGIVNRGGDVPDLTTLDSSTFAIDYPKGWDQRCETEWQGYPVCGIANHRWYNEVDRFAGTNIDLGQMVGDLFGSALTGEDVPEESVSIIAMDVPRTSWAYDDRSWAKTLYDWGFGDNPNYEQDVIEVDGHQAYYYEYTSKGRSFTWAAWDVYIEHDGIVFWLRVDYFADRKGDIPHELVAKMIESIDIKSASE